jgi:hypothetical protein
MNQTVVLVHPAKTNQEKHERASHGNCTPRTLLEKRHVDRKFWHSKGVEESPPGAYCSLQVRVSGGLSRW